MKYISTTLISFLFLLNSNLFSQAPIADFSFNPNGCVGVAHNFTDISANAPNSFYWTFGDGNSSTNQNPSNVYLTAGTYLVTFVAINANGSDTIAYNVTIYDNPIINAGTDQTICFGTSIGLSASGGFTYIWAPATSLSSNTVSNPIASPTTTTAYSVTGTDANGCTANDMVTVTVNPLPNVNAGVDQTICFGAPTSLSGSGAVTYNWTPGSSLSSTTIPNPSANPTSTTTYTLTGTDANGCTNTDDVTIIVNSSIVITSSVTNVSCNGANDGSITITPFGGQPPYVFFWSPSGNTTAVVTGLPFGNHTVTVTDANGCSEQLMETVTEPTAITINFGINDISCIGSSDGEIYSTVNGGTPPYTYSWSNSSTTQDILSIPAGTYILTVNDSTGCVKMDSATIDEHLPSSTINGIVYYQTIPITSGVAELIRKDGSLPTDMTLVQTANINPTSGEFIFFELPAANYIIKVLGDTTMYNCAATYYNLTAQWQLAQELTIASSCNDSIYLDIDLIELPSNSGTGAINGRLVEGSGLFNKAPGEPLGDIDITLNQSPGGTIMAATTTDSLGYFTVTNLPMGTYTVYADMHGYGVTLQTIDINATTPSYDIVLCSDTAIDMIEMCEMTVTSVKKVATTNLLSIYPNPAKTTLNIVYNGSEALNLEVTDITGKKVMSQTLKTKTIDVTGLNQGLYFVRLYNQHDDFIQKLVIE